MVDPWRYSCSLKLDDVSLAPHFSEVITRESLFSNRFNGFSEKPLKRLVSLCGFLVTSLK